jgi:predicted extracellular nuclease
MSAFPTHKNQNRGAIMIRVIHTVSFFHRFRKFSLLTFLLAGNALPAVAQDLVITGVVDGPLTGGVPKAIEICVRNDVADLSVYGLGSANNGGGSDGEEFTFPAGPASAGTFLYVASEAGGFTDFFGFAPTYTSGAASINGDDAIELFMSGSVVDVFGDIDASGTAQPWDYQDGWAYRSGGSGPDGSTFVLANWIFSGPNALDGETVNASSAAPFPIASYPACEAQEPSPDVLLSEIVVTPTGGEFIEIHNPTGATIDLSDVYITDATFAGGGTYYYNIVTGTNAGGGGFSDFHARFPGGATIAAGDYQAISLAGSDGFFAAYGVAPDYELFEDGVSADGVPDMLEALPGSINGQGGLTNSGEVVILYAWDGESDLVQDIDYVVWGDKDEAVDKTGVGVDGPDADSDASFYLADTVIASQGVVADTAHDIGESFQRVDFNEGSELQTGGNGLTGSDETSEDLQTTWETAAATPGAAPPGPPEPPAVAIIINEILADPASGLAGDANGDGVRDSTEDEFVEIVNASGADVDISGWTLADGFTVRHEFPAGSILPDGCSVVVFGGGTPTGAFGISLVQTASTGALGLNNNGDNLTLSNGGSDVATANYGSEGGDNQSLTLDPDITGVPPLVKHSIATGSAGAVFSPGTRVDGSQFSGCPSVWVINEINADPASGSDGDANGDGDGNFSADEFVEIVNRSGQDIDISGWTLADGFSVRHEFPAGSVVFNGCSVVVFGGGTPTGAFGNSLVQTASGGSLGLNNGGDTLTLNNGASDVSTAGYGGEGGDNQSLTLDPDVSGLPPYVKHSLASDSGGVLFSPGTKIDGSPFDGCPITAAVYEIQGAGDESPLVGTRVIATGVVTALAPDGFFMQLPLDMADGDPDTSDGIFVFTGDAPTVSVGDQVEVVGTVSEFFGFTEISGSPLVTVTGTGAVPAPVVLDATLPSPDPAAPGCSLEFECYEGMLVEIVDGTVTGPNQRFGTDPVAEVYITAAPARTFREPGVAYPGLTMPPIPTWDGNPEVFELDPDKLGLPNRVIPAGSSFSATGVIGYEFGGYELWPFALDVTAAPLPVAVRAREPGELTVGTLNLFRLFDDIDDPADGDRNDAVVATDEYQRRLAKFSAHIRTVLGAPDILAVQEVESLAVLNDLAAVIASDDPGVSYRAYLEEGNDVGTIDVGFLVRDNIRVDTVTQLGKDETFVNPITSGIDILHDRPPLLLQGSVQLAWGSYPIDIMAVHNRSLGGIDGSEGLRVRVKRLRQAESIAMKVQSLQDANPDVRLIVTGDFNDFEFTDGFVDAIGVISGNFDPLTSLVCSEVTCVGDLVEPNLDNQVFWVPDNERYSFIFQGSAQVLDHALTSGKLAAEVSGVQFGRGNADAAVDLINDDGSADAGDLPLRSSDHDGLVVYINGDSDADGVANDDDACPATRLPEGVPTESLGTNRFADTDGDGIFDTTPSIGGGPNRAFDLGDTAGCSCEQIIAAEGLGEGHTKFGCSISAMEDWVYRVTP